jgi:hypothetical protein
MPRRKTRELGETDYANLIEDISASRDATRFQRRTRTAGLRDYAGNRFSEEGARLPMPCNLLALFAQVVGQKLISDGPRASLSTENPAERRNVGVMEQWGNEQAKATNMQETLARAVFDAMWVGGVVMVALAEPDDAEVHAWNLDAGVAFAECIDYDDFHYDTNATSFDEMKFVGNRYYAPLDTIRDSDLYSKDRKDLVAATMTMYDDTGEEKASAIAATTYTSGGNKFDPQVELIQVYLPRYRVICTFMTDGDGRPVLGKSGEPLRVQEWIGPPWGPYIPLSLGPPMPGSVWGTAPYQNLVDLNLIANKLYSKLFEQAVRQKDVGMVKKSATEDAEEIRRTRDGHTVAVTDPEAIINMKFGGPDAANTVFAKQVIDLFSKFAGNLELLGGLAPQSGTAKQDSMLNENASGVMADMQQRAVAFFARVFESQFWFWYHDPFKVMRVNYQLPGLPEASIRREVTPKQRPRAGWKDLRLKIDPYSVQYQSPQQKAAKLTALVTGVVLPMLPILGPQGVQFDAQEFLSIIAGWENMPEVKRILSIVEPPPVEEGMAAEKPGMPGETTRNYVRESRSAGTPGAEANQLETEMAAATSDNRNQ